MKNNSMNNYLNQSYKYNNNTNIKLVPKTKSLNNFNTNTLKILRHANQFKFKAYQNKNKYTTHT